MSQHTPGPWTVKPNDGVRVPYRIEGDGWTVCEVYWNEHMDGDTDANARLIAAAPALLEALEHAMAYLDRLHDHTRTSVNTFIDESGFSAMASAALVQARGRKS